MGVFNRLVQDGLARQAQIGDNDKFTRSAVANATDAAQVISAAAIVGGFYKRSGQTAGRTDTTDTGVAIDLVDGNLDIGESFTLLISNQAAQILTLAGGVGVTVTSTKTTVIASGSATVIFTKTGVGTYDAYVL